MKLAYVYRIYQTSGQLLYVGVTTNLKNRLANHRCKAWWPLGDVYLAIEGPMDMPSALEIEQEAIKEEDPLINGGPLARVLRSIEEQTAGKHYKIEDIPGYPLDMSEPAT